MQFYEIFPIFQGIGLIKDQRLYLDAMPMFKPKTKGHTELCQSYGDYLLTKKYFEDAALIYESGGLLGWFLISRKNFFGNNNL